MDFIASKLLWSLTAPGNLLVLLLVGGGVVQVVRPLQGVGRWAVRLGVVGLLAVATLPLGVWMIRPLEARFPRPAAEPARVDGVIVLGGAVDTRSSEATGQPTLNGAAERMTEAMALARRYPQARIVFTGGSGRIFSGELSEADVAAALWQGMGLPPERTTYESASRNTWENARDTLALVRPRPGEVWLLVTSAWHMPRAVGCFRTAGWDVVAWPVDHRSAARLDLLVGFSLADGLEVLETATREWIGLVAYRLMGRIDTLFPAP